jgi:hypothetical protein
MLMKSRSCFNEGPDGDAKPRRYRFYDPEDYKFAAGKRQLLPAAEIHFNCSQKGLFNTVVEPPRPKAVKDAV